MVPHKYEPRYVVQTFPGPCTGGGAGDVYLDNRGQYWTRVEHVANQTGPSPAKIFPDGRIEP